MGMIKELITQERKIKKLSKEYHTNIKAVFLGLIAVEKRSKEKEWGLPLLRHDLDWYSIEEIRRQENERKNII